MAPKAPPKGRTRIKGVRQNQSAFLRDGVSNSKAKKRQIYKWVQKEEAILGAVRRGRGHLQKIRATALATVLCDEDEDLIAHWVRDLRCEGMPVSPFILENKAKEVAEDAGIPVESFSASDS
ncbi:hypothetical protein PHPALM_31353 [Phytophthora palmivora]|uniref:HTH CENPB-type domain-containing protein n=1 Tax=Phytophthora palmivora TaxID=4796 RepID=A0A2P4X2U1_9STRA|nr:hypothetical protein PHPALM_31353 [Phytophthora palmivora]